MKAIIFFKKVKETIKERKRKDQIIQRAKRQGKVIEPLP